ncbi:Xaa-Pro dipeptidase [archaeon HR01]|nr:Xaa-Pro dipeptidase [archaeon HR01]
MDKLTLAFDIGEFRERLSRLCGALASHGVDAAIVSSWENLYYLQGIITMYTRSRVVDPMPLVVGRGVDEVFFVPTRMFSIASELEHPYIAHVQPYDGPHPWKTIANIIEKLGLANGRIAVEYRNLVVSHLQKLRGFLPEAHFIDCSPIINEIRSVKSAKEQEYLRKSCEITDEVLEITMNDLLKPRKTEMEVAGEMIKAMIDAGAEGASFHPQVLTGYRSALLNISSSDKLIEESDVVMLDFGACYKGYCSDTARPVILGKSTTEEQRRACDAALEITLAALKAVKPGVKASEIHAAAVSRARELGYEKNLRHSSGHGIGLNVWEPPTLANFDDTVIKEGMTLAVEQGVYFDRFGFRFEQNVIVTKNGYEPMFKAEMKLAEV